MQKRRRGSSSTPSRQQKRPRINEQIRATEVLLVSPDRADVRQFADVLQEAREQEMDVIEVSPKANPPVVKIGDFGQYLYQLRKKERKQRVHSKQTEVKMLRLGFRTERHDIERLMDRAREFFKERHLVKFVVRLRGRELGNRDYAKAKLLSIVDGLKDCSEVEQELKQQGPMFHVILRGKQSS
ncbi:MAG: translation initiation factor IF-3 [Candidatus Peregrinibacteria bacterium]